MDIDPLFCIKKTSKTSSWQWQYSSSPAATPLRNGRHMLTKIGESSLVTGEKREHKCSGSFTGGSRGENSFGGYKFDGFWGENNNSMTTAHKCFQVQHEQILLLVRNPVESETGPASQSNR